ncbi:hypothetical protein PMIT1342_02255 [Prochlorococcus marinus str. MIT 1342]|uniref:hypothetical protein n=1 Tax=Prochlorococcus TaxID=1218 RepID=UPI0007B31B54|nr:hypothetical protein [Prochlorococcus marinus]KZR80308.1 hypothetical protein PMIT1342_02255 [Prochlorococcus marinus str. MIT 1342]
MDEQQERDFYEQQKNMPRYNPNLGYIKYLGLASLSTSPSKTRKWFARVSLLMIFTVLIGGIVMSAWDLFNMQSIEEKEYSAPR